MNGPSPIPAATLRRMRWWDVPEVARIESDVFPDPWSVEAFWSELAHVPRTRHYIVADLAGALVGYAGLGATRHQADVLTLAVARAHQGNGLGRRMLGELLAEARRREVGEVLLDVRADNAAAQTLYDHAGFERIGVRRGYYRPGGTDALVMRLRL